jgi:hypothetical protein
VLELRMVFIPERRLRREKRPDARFSTGGASVDVDARVLGGSFGAVSSSTFDTIEAEIDNGRSICRTTEFDRGRGVTISLASATDTSGILCLGCWTLMTFAFRLKERAFRISG